MFSVHFPWTNDGPAEVSDQWGRSVAGGWFPASHFYGTATKFGSQAARNRRNLMPTHFQQENMGIPTPARLSLGFPYQQGLWSPNFGHTTNALLGSVAVVPTARPGADVETEKELQSRKTVSAVFRNQFRKVINNRWWNVIKIMSAEFLRLPQKNPATHIYCLGCIYDKQGGSFLVGVRKRLRLYRWATSSEFQHFFPWTGWYHLMLNKYSN